MASSITAIQPVVAEQEGHIIDSVSQTGGGKEKIPGQDIATSENHSHTQTKVPNLIRYRVHYADSEGTLLDKGPYFQQDPDLRADPEEEATDAIFDIIIEVTIRDVVENKSDVQDTAAQDGQDQKMNVRRGVKTGNIFTIKSVNSSKMVIRSPHIIEALRSVVKFDHGVELAGETISVPEPYHFLVYQQKKLGEYFANKENEVQSEAEYILGENTSGSLAIEHFKILGDFLDTKWKTKVQKEHERHAQSVPVATWDMLWLLYKPGTPVFAPDFSGETSGFIVRSAELNPNKAKSLLVKLWYMEFDGTDLDRRLYEEEVLYFEGAREISSLPIYPVRLTRGEESMPLNANLYDKLVSRGRNYWSCTEKVFQESFVEIKYSGDLYASPDKYRGRAIIDPRYFYVKSEKSIPDFLVDGDFENDENNYWSDPQGSDHAGRNPWSKFQWIRATNAYHEIDEEHFFLMPSRIGGFLLKTRKWQYLKIENVTEHQPDPSVVESLQIPSETLHVIRALVHKYQTKYEAWAADFIQSKGEGRIFLLHGPSGVGKTYTAECISEYTGRPLLSLTCADIGTDENEMENLLATWFTICERWGAILLIDEADVYFERRAAGQLQRNSLVSAFLRSMEYYSGILFLTTNRLGHMDDAVLSRIHMVVEYPDLSDETRWKIWDQFFNRLVKDRPEFAVDVYLRSFIKNSDEVLDLKWNGREIRNAFQTAVSLAVHEAKTATPPQEKILIQKEHLQNVVKMSKAFQNYMQDFKGDLAKRALVDGARMDESMRQVSKDRKNILDELRKQAKAKR